MTQGPPLNARQARYRREQQRRRRRNRFFLLSFCVILLLSGIITALIKLPGHGKVQASESMPSASAPETDESAPTAAAETGSSGAASSAQTADFGPLQQPEVTYTTPTAAQYALGENGRVDVFYFDDALFIGDSITQGFQVYSSGITNAHYAAYVGAGPKQLMSGTVTNVNGEMVKAIDEILAANPTKVYILLGTNSLSSLDDEAFLKYYEDFLDYLSPQLPAGTVYYLQAIPPATAEKSAGDESYASARIQQLNEQIAAMAYRRGWHYLDLFGALADENGVLRADVTAGSDGVHLNSAGYAAWKDFLLTHTAYSPSSPYIAGSPYLTAQ